MWPPHCARKHLTFSSVLEICARHSRSTLSMLRDTMGTPYSITVDTCKEAALRREAEEQDRWEATLKTSDRKE